MLPYEDRSKCCGCGVCETVCKHSAITMQNDELGFVYPVVNEDKCVDCGICRAACRYGKNEMRQPQETYAAADSDLMLKRNSSSGGVFASIAKEFISSGGTVCGAVMIHTDAGMETKHILTDDPSDLIKLQGSKYVRSNAYECYGDMERALKAGRTVLFSGTPCQVDAVRDRFGRKYPDQLFLIDIICHGTPDQKFFNDYLALKEKKENAKIIEYAFRDKQYGWGLSGSMRVLLKNGEIKNLKVEPQSSSYYRFFLNGETYRDNCYSCPYAQIKRVGDITIGDYWGINKYAPELLSENGGPLVRREGISCVLINNNKGKRILTGYGKNLILAPARIEDIRIINTQLNEPAKYTWKRKVIFGIYKRTGYKGVERFFGFLQLKRNIKHALKTLVTGR